MTDRSPTAPTPADPDKSRRLLETAAGEFARVGFERASIDTIALRAGVGKGTVYLYFSSKADLFLAVLAGVRRRLAAALEVDTSADPAAALSAVILAHLRLADAAPDLFRCYTSALFGVNRDFQAAALDIFTWQQQTLDQLLQRAGVADDARSPGRRAALLAGSILSAGLVRALLATRAAGTVLEETVLLDGFLASVRSPREGP